ncbi:MAG: ATP-binding cassette domain-containing protein [Alphaproteobacteria bacterium]|nr:ATP-binding cassette domain-containing protein [Alphaproteobacteria bacterium]
MPSPLLHAEHLSKRFPQPGNGYLQVVGDISLSLQPGEIVCLLGASGSGKTTLLRILAGLDAADSGEIQSELRRPSGELGYMSQNDRLLPWRSVRGNVSIALELLGQDKKSARQAALASLKQVGMEAFAASYPSQLSGGMIQRVLLARALVLQPRLLLMDEPMSNLDVLARRELSLLIKNYIHGHEKSALVVTHSVEEACFIADRVLLVSPSPATLFKEIRIDDNGGAAKGAVSRNEALNIVMKELWMALGAAA